MQKALINIVDFGLVVLIWLVQLIIYPAFGKIDRSLFISWHAEYTRWITVIVAPLMFAQLFLAIWQLSQEQHVIPWLRIILVASVWGLTFFYAVPLHNQLDVNGNSPELVGKLIAANWPRTIIWSVLFILGLIHLR